VGAPWIAVDEEGCIARFWPNASGKTPPRARGPGRRAALDDAVDVACLLRRLVDPELERQRPDALVADRMLVVLDGVHTDPGYRDSARSTDPIERELAAFSPRVLRESSPRVLLTQSEVDMPSILRLAPDARVKHLLGMRDVLRMVTPSSTWGLHHYEHDDKFHARSSQYARRGTAPRLPLDATALPEPERSALMALRLPLRFRDTEEIDVKGVAAMARPADRIERGRDRRDPLRRPSRGAPTGIVFVLGPIALWLFLRLVLRVFAP
jgi:hypothetical protein